MTQPSTQSCAVPVPGGRKKSSSTPEFASAAPAIARLGSLTGLHLGETLLEALNEAGVASELLEVELNERAWQERDDILRVRANASDLFVSGLVDEAPLTVKMGLGSP